MKFWIFCFCFIISSYACAGWIAQDATVEYVENTSGNNDVFTVLVSGGTGPCVSTLITFPKSSATSEAIFTRAFTLLTAANVSGRKVSIYNYLDQSCTNAVGVRLAK